MRADQPPSNPEQWLLPLAVDELGDALDVVRALTDEADATAVAARAALEDDPIVEASGSAEDEAPTADVPDETPEPPVDAETPADSATGEDAAPDTTVNAETKSDAAAEEDANAEPTSDAAAEEGASTAELPDETPEPPADAETPAEPATDDRSADAGALPAAAMAAEAAEAAEAAADENQGSGGQTSPARPEKLDSPEGELPAEAPQLHGATPVEAVGAEGRVGQPVSAAEQHEPETIRIGGTPAAVAAAAAAAAATSAAPSAAATTAPAAPAAPAAAAPSPPDAPAPPPRRSGGGGDGGDRRHLLVAAAFVGLIALAVATIAVVLGTRSDSAHVARPAATPTSGSGFTMTLTAPPGSGGAKSSTSPRPSRAAAKPKPTPKATTKPAAVAGPQCSGSGWQQRRLQSAISRLTYDYGRVGISVAAAPARDGVLAIGDKSTGVVTAYVRNCAEESAPLLAAAVADQMAQLIDLQVLTNSERVDWMRRRGFAGGTTWDPDGLIDYASVFTRWQVGPGFWRSSLAPPSASELEVLKRWYAPN